MKLTWLRIVLILPGMGSLFLGWPYAALAIFIIASATDWLDGRIARRTKTTSELGAFLDPLADKLLVYLYFGFLMSVGAYPAWLFLGMLARDMINDAFRSFAASRRVILSANMWSKVKTVLQMFSIAAALVLLAISSGSTYMTSVDVWLLAAANILMVLALICGVVGSVLFIYRGKSVLR